MLVVQAPGIGNCRHTVSCYESAVGKMVLGDLPDSFRQRRYFRLAVVQTYRDILVERPQDIEKDSYSHGSS
jgi:hypothetical protein